MKDIKSEFPIRSWQLFWYICILLVGSIGNSTVIIVIVKSKKIQTFSTFNILLLSLAIADLMISLVGLPNYILSTDAYVHPEGDYGIYVCKFFTGYLFPFWLLDISAFLLVTITIERRRAILHPLWTLSGTSILTKVLTIAGIVVLSFVVQLPTVTGMKYDKLHPTVGNCCTYKYDWLESVIIYAFVVTIETLIPVVIMVTSFRQVRRKMLSTDDILKPSMYAYRDEEVYNAKKKMILYKKMKTIETMKLVVVAFFLCIIPNNIFYVLFQFANVRKLTWNSVIYQLAVLMRFSNSCVNPILYSFHSNEFRKHCHEVFKPLLPQRSNIETKTINGRKTYTRLPESSGHSLAI